MNERRSTYIVLAALVLAGLTAYFVFWGGAGDDASPVDGSEAEALTGSPDSGAGKGKTGAGAAGEDNYVMKLINKVSRMPQFGNYRLRSVMVNDVSPELSRATIEEVDKGASRIYSIHEKLPDKSELMDIRQQYVIVEKSGVRRRLGITPRSPGELGAEGFARTGENEFLLNPYQVFKGDADSVLDFSLKVHTRNGSMNGIQLSGVKSGTLAHQLGLKDGDVLLAVNRKPVDSLINSVRACMNAHNSDELQLKVLRGGREVTVTYQLLWEGRGAWTSGDVLNSKAISSLMKGGLLPNLF